MSEHVAVKKHFLQANYKFDKASLDLLISNNQ